AMTGGEAMRACFEAVTENAAKVMGIEGYGLAPGRHADLVILEAADPIEAIRLRAARLYVVRRGKIIAERPSSGAALHIAGRPKRVAFTGPWANGVPEGRPGA
ncbi:MAG: amidohydrolase family protein, partial [Alphaproteobacteria bacterium]